jgi:predicted RNA-binding protein with PUA-like domain
MELSAMPLVKKSRLSVSAVGPKEFERILNLGGTKL